MRGRGEIQGCGGAPTLPYEYIGAVGRTQREEGKPALYSLNYYVCIDIVFFCSNKAMYECNCYSRVGV